MISLARATPQDSAAIAALHAESWRNAYRGMLSDQYLDEGVFADRAAFWKERFDTQRPERQFILKATSQNGLDGFACALLDAEPAWGARLDNLHVRPQLIGRGIGHALFNAARAWIAEVTQAESMHLWVVEANHTARRFYDRQGGAVVERATRLVARGLSVLELRYHWPPVGSR
jgi:GNAT superfamily N-acetyltransferase